MGTMHAILGELPHFSKKDHFSVLDFLNWSRGAVLTQRNLISETLYKIVCEIDSTWPSYMEKSREGAVTSPLFPAEVIRWKNANVQYVPDGRIAELAKDVEIEQFW